MECERFATERSQRQQLVQTPTYSSNESEFTGGRFKDRVATCVSSLKLVTTKEEELEKYLWERRLAPSNRKDEDNIVACYWIK
jgi:hypothetical protein